MVGTITLLYSHCSKYRSDVDCYITFDFAEVPVHNSPIANFAITSINPPYPTPSCCVWGGGVLDDISNKNKYIIQILTLNVNTHDGGIFFYKVYNTSVCTLQKHGVILILI